MKIKPSVLALGFFLVAILLYSAVFSPMSDSLIRKDAELAIEHARLLQTQQDITSHGDMLKRIDTLKQHSKDHREKLIVPMLNSYAMQVKSFLDVMAREAGLTSVEYEESGSRALPLPMNMVPPKRTARRLVRIKAIGDYAAIVSFILRAEHELPLMAVHSLSITQPSSFSPDFQSVELTVEWPCEGEVIQ